LQGLQPVGVAFDGAATYQASYANRFIDGKVAALYGEVVVAGAPRTAIKTSSVFLPRSYSSLFLTPGLKLKLLPGAAVSPYVAAGGGAGRYQASETAINGQPITGGRTAAAWVFDYGGGVDFNVLSVLALRVEARDFITGLPQLSRPFFDERQHNVVVAGGIVLRW
jgi:opacity protein-like surface antigen